jgi:hypothetical protein
MKNVTITLDEKVALWARLRAAKQETSVSRLVGEMLKEKMLNEEHYQASMQHYLSQTPRMLKKPGTGYPDRKELYPIRRPNR